MVGGAYLLCGGAQGAMLALVTRTRNPWLIYLALAIAVLLFYPLFEPLFPGAVFSLRPWTGAPEIVYNYFDALRIFAFLFGIPYPYARFGQHAADPIPPGAEVDEDNAHPPGPAG